MLNPQVKKQSAEFANAFEQALPFRHVVIDEFLDANSCQRLLAEFPEFDPSYARNEGGLPGLKAVTERIVGLGGAYIELDRLFASASFRQTIGRITGTENLIYDAHYYGGGAHENLHGQDLDPHVDFNYHPANHHHRRLNLILYLNKVWDQSWGGALELHSDPRLPEEENRIVSVLPLFNRAVIFETTENSWHGFRRIAVPADQAGVTRKSIALYYYTKIRPVAETAPDHSTVYVERPLPAHIKSGHTLSQEDAETITRMITRRDAHLARLYDEIQQNMATRQRTRQLLSPLFYLRRMFRPKPPGTID